MMASYCSFPSIVRTIFVLILPLVVHGQQIRSPCPNIFSYRLSRNTGQIYGYIEVQNLRVGQIAKTVVELSVPAKLSPNNFGSIQLVKSREQTGKDILRGRPAQYKINFPIKTATPTVKSITLNGRPICRGSQAKGKILTTIKLQHKLATLFKTNNIVSRRVINQQRRAPQRIALPKDFYSASNRASFQSNPLRRKITKPSNVCGKPVVGFTRFSINGKRTEKGQFPWMVPLFLKTSEEGEKPIYICGGSLVNMRYVVSAAHCVFLEYELIQKEKLLAAPGLFNIDNFFEESAVFTGIKKIYPHPGYVDDDPNNDLDIAVLLLIKTMPRTPYIIPICLWKGDDSLDRVVGKNGLVAGWGVTDDGPTPVPNYFTTRIVSKNQCKAHLKRLFPIGKIFCGDGLGASPCNGDSGSGVAILRGNQYFLRGVVSRGQVNSITLKCDVSKLGIYTDVAPFRYWLRSIMG